MTAACVDLGIPTPHAPGEAWQCPNGHRHFVCAACLQLYTTRLPPEESKRAGELEALKNLGEIPENSGLVCDTCYPILMERAREDGLIP